MHNYCHFLITCVGSLEKIDKLFDHWGGSEAGLVRNVLYDGACERRELYYVCIPPLMQALVIKIAQILSR